MNRHALITLALVYAFLLPAQNAATEPAVAWDNGNITYLKDLGTVYLHLKNGKVIHNARISRIDTVRKLIEYQREGTMHDLSFRHFDFALPSKRNGSHLLCISPAMVPVIKSTSPPNEDAASFPVSVFAFEKRYEQLTRIAKHPGDSLFLRTRKGSCEDTLRRDREQIPVSVLEIGDLVKYRRRDVPDGPLYIISAASLSRIEYHTGHVTLILKQ
jgi:hypothetical protein